ncbi:aspartate--tRNA ligase, mitochondrial [Wyeomyia smithii]|uniref:aspartate--tRNA ligase, mitochondrial n=1 Tax=Wyeomyia smithii TaxID=174621 RepID=UPI002467B42C|nr:aspartate--tRNA ligase, mitochondrial [Wyeomyia smithii]
MLTFIYSMHSSTKCFFSLRHLYLVKPEVLSYSYLCVPVPGLHFSKSHSQPYSSSPIVGRKMDEFKRRRLNNSAVPGIWSTPPENMAGLLTGLQHELRREVHRDSFQQRELKQRDFHRDAPRQGSGIRRVNCGELREWNHGEKVEISGKVTENRMGKFLDVCDASGSVQVVSNNVPVQLHKRVTGIVKDNFVTIVGRVQERPARLKNSSIPTGGIDVMIEEIVRIEGEQQMGRNANFTKRNYSTVASPAQAFTRGVTSHEIEKSTSDSILKYFKNRKTICSEFRLKDVGKKVQLVGWIDRKNKHDRFLFLRDGHGAVQLMVENVSSEVKNNIQAASGSSIVLVKGTVLARPANCVNTSLDTGSIEIIVDEFQILNPDEPYNGPEALETAETSVEELSNSRFTNRTHNCGELRLSNADQKVVLCGWLEFSRMNKFITLRDGYGITQIVVPDDMVPSVNIGNIAFESILRVEGTVSARPAGHDNPRQATGQIEVVLDKVEVLNEARKRLPIDSKEFNKAKENLRIEHRYIDLRAPHMQRNLRLRSQVIMKMREYMINKCGFVEVETPTLFRRTPGGAQEFVVPTRKPGHFYSLVQSPQQFKQMLMSGAIDRYFQIARCYRDEATRPDRQPEFTQLDIELSFTDRDKIMQLVENVLASSWPDDDNPLKVPFQRITYDEAMARFGCDKPDTRFGYELQDVSAKMNTNEKVMLGLDSLVYRAYAIVAKEPHSGTPTAFKKALDALSKEHSKCKLVFSNINNDWLNSSIVKLLDQDVAKALNNHLALKPGDLLLLGYGKAPDVQEMMGKVRLAFYDNLESRGLVEKRSSTAQNFVWLHDFPLFAPNDETGGLDSVHHPFTAPHPDDVAKLKQGESLTEIRSQSFDLVWNGVEIGGGSVRIHNGALQKMVLDDILKVDHSHLQHLLDALEYGCPPHGGFAVGLDRYISLLCNAHSIRDVIAFPKTLDGKDPLSKAPVPISEEEKKIYHLATMETSNK